MLKTWRSIPSLMQDAITVYAFSIFASGVIGGIIGASIRSFRYRR